MSQQTSDLVPPEVRTEPLDFLKEHLNVQWLRPESALWDAIASSLISKIPFESPSLDLGCGDGLFSFITAGGAFSPQWDRYRSTGPDPIAPERWIVRAPRHRIDWALDRRADLLEQAGRLEFYGARVVSDANRWLPFEAGSFQTVFSNILYWLDSPEPPLREIWRLLRPSGRVWLCLPDPGFIKICTSYTWRDSGSRLLRLLNRGRSENIRWILSGSEWEGLVQRIGFKLLSDRPFLSPLVLRCWDIGLRPLFPVLLKVIRPLDDGDRLRIKEEWIRALRPFLEELVELDRHGREPAGFHLIGLEKQ